MVRRSLLSTLKSWSQPRNFVIGVPYVWLLAFFAIPFVIVLKISFSWMQPIQPGYAPLIEWVEETRRLVVSFNFDNYQVLLRESLYVDTFLYSAKVAAVSTFWCLLIGYPMAYAIARSKPSTRNLLLMLIILPFWTSFLLRVYAWVGLLKTNGVINNTLLALGLIDEPLTLLYTDFAVYIGIVYSYLPFMILPLYSNLEKHDLTLLEAAADLGARPFKAFLKVTLPLSMPGIVAGCLLVFIPAVGEFVIPSLLGRTDQLMIGTVLSAQFFGARNWPVAGAVAIVLLLVLLLPILLFQRYQRRELEAARR
ncbi:MAG: ABC transporter permease subunit [Acidibacter sp.]|jgi:putrescine transport system permease protein|nr:ABC transporter permease subunit [Acidibacter sp.]